MGEVYSGLLECLRKGNRGIIFTKMRSDKGVPQKIEKVCVEESKLDLVTTVGLREEGKVCLENGSLKLMKGSEEEFTLIEPFFPEERLIIFGGGHISQPLVKFGAEIGFSVTVVDDRPSFANTARFPEAKNVICEGFDRCFSKVNITGADYVVIVTRGHKNDLDCLKQTLNINPRYIGMIGSKRRVKLVKEGLIEEGYKKDLVDHVHSPIGLNIGAITPAEIAISIMAEIITVKRLGETTEFAGVTKKTGSPDVDYDVLRKLAEENEEKKAIITIVSTKGSTPRHTGAKMLVWEDGRTLGSIGGGCSEADVIRTAREMISVGGYRFYKVDMTGTYAEEEGMVCGGIMEVLIEVF